jgi:hypothetical protein
MNLFLPNIGELVGEPAVARADALIAEPTMRVNYVLANPPFGKKSSMTITNEEGEEDRDALTYERQDFWETTSNKQLNFLQHIASMLKVDGNAVVLPDNVLFEGGAGERIRRKLLETCDVHTILRLPTGIFYAQGVKANVVFFDNAPKDGRIHTQGVWFYDLRTNQHLRSESERSRTTASTRSTTCRRPMCCSRKSSTTSKPPWPRSGMSRRACRRSKPDAKRRKRHERRQRIGWAQRNRISYRYLENAEQEPFMATKPTPQQIAFRYRAADSATGLTRATAKRLAAYLGVDETQAIHLALHELATKVLPQYEPDDGPLTAAQIRQIRKHAPQGGKRSVRSSLFDTEVA